MEGGRDGGREVGREGGGSGEIKRTFLSRKLTK